MRILFMGTPDFAVPSLAALVAAGHTLCGVFTQPDRPKNRGMQVTASPVKQFAITHNIPVFQPEKLRDGTALAQIRDVEPELIVVAAYGRILPDDILSYPALGCINVHSSLLPKFRGAAPINWAILEGETETGVTIMYMASELDAGDIIATCSTPISPQETAPMLYSRLAQMGGDLLHQVVEQIAQGTAQRTPQNHAQATLAPMLDKSLSPMEWSRPALALHNQVRGLQPWPSAIAQIDGVRCKVLETALTGEYTQKSPGQVVSADKNGLTIACGDGAVLELCTIQPDGKKAMTAAAFLLGHPIVPERS